MTLVFFEGADPTPPLFFFTYVAENIISGWGGEANILSCLLSAYVNDVHKKKKERRQPPACIFFIGEKNVSFSMMVEDKYNFNIDYGLNIYELTA